MTEKRPSWKDILWSPIYDFVDSRWGTRGLRLFAISIGLVVVAVAWWGLSETRTSELGPQVQQYVTDLRENVRSLGAGLSRNVIKMAVFLSDILEKGLRVMVRLSHDR